jgi:hypothetical protein
VYVILCHLAFKKDGRISYGVAEPIVTTPLIALDNLDYCRLSSHMTILSFPASILCPLRHTLVCPLYPDLFSFPSCRVCFLHTVVLSSIVVLEAGRDLVRLEAPVRVLEILRRHYTLSLFSRLYHLLCRKEYVSADSG